MSDSSTTLIPLRWAAFFDLEGTLTPDAVEKVAALEMRRRGELSLWQILKVVSIYLRYDLGFIKDFDAMKRAGAPVLAGREEARDLELYRALFESRLAPAIYPEALAEISALREAGAEIWIVSATYGFMVAPFAERLSARGWFGTHLEVAEGRFTGRIIGQIPGREVKGALVRDVIAARALDRGACHAYGDSVNDADMLRVVGHGHVINPRGELAKLAEAAGWEVHRWGARS